MRRVGLPALLASMLALSGMPAWGADAASAGPGTVRPNALPTVLADSPSPGQPVGWRGDGTGLFPSARPLTRWSAPESVRWKAQVGAGQSSPVVVDRRVFVTAEPDSLVCLDADTGRELWRKRHRWADLPEKTKDPGQSSPYGDTTPTPVSDGRHVWVFVGTGIVACYDLEGTARWIRGFDLPLATQYGRTASPVLVGNRLLVHFGPLVCLDAATGRLLWKNDQAKASYGTPIRARIGDVDVIVTPKGDVVRLADGKTLATGLGNCQYASPVMRDNVVYFVESDVVAVRLPEQVTDAVQCQELWFVNLDGEFYASPVIEAGRLYAVDKGARCFVLDAKSGKPLAQQPLPFSRAEDANVYSSLSLAGGHLFVGNDAGEWLVLEPNERSVVVGKGSLPAGSGATPVFREKRMWIRGGEHLYCISAP